MAREPEYYEPWFPIDGLPKELYFGSLTEGTGPLTIVLEIPGSEDTVVFSFEYSIIYRSTDETYRWVSLAEASSVLPGGGILGLWTVRNSRFLAWLNEESSGIAAYNRLTHYAFVLATGEVVDVIAGAPPEVRWLRSEASAGTQVSENDG